MSGTYRNDVILALDPRAAQPGEIERVNGLLEQEGLGRPLRAPLGQPEAEAAVAVLPVTADPVAIRDALRRVSREHGEELPELTPDFQYVAGTVDDNARDHDLYYASGRKGGRGHKGGHGAIAWLSAPRYEIGDAPLWRPARQLPSCRRPVIALLDTGVKDHPWLPEPVENERFWVEPAGWGPRRRIPPPRASRRPDSDRENLGSHWGHGTFVAGLIRLAAPDAQVLSMRVMSDDGLAATSMSPARWTGWRTTATAIRSTSSAWPSGVRRSPTTPTSNRSERPSAGSPSSR